MAPDSSYRRCMARTATVQPDGEKILRLLEAHRQRTGEGRPDVARRIRRDPSTLRNVCRGVDTSVVIMTQLARVLKVKDFTELICLPGAGADTAQPDADPDLAAAS